MKSLIAMLAVLISSNAFASDFLQSDEWSNADKALLTASMISYTADWAQTRHIARNPDKWYETNAMMGEHPSVGRVNAYFIGSMLLTAVIADALPSTLRKVYLTGTVVYELSYVRKNLNIGIGVRF